MVAVRRVVIQAPFTDGMVTDVPAHLLGPRMSSRSENLITIDGTARRRRGWRWTGGRTMGAAVIGVRSADFALAGASRRVVTTAEGAFDEMSAAQLVQFYGDLLAPTITAAPFIPRCVYRDEVILCPVDGQRGILRYAGAGWNDGSNSGWNYALRQVASAQGGNPVTMSLNASAGSARLNYATPVTNPQSVVALNLLTASQPGWYAVFAPFAAVPALCFKLVNIDGAGTAVLGSAVSSGSALSNTGSVVMPFGFAYPAVSVYSGGSVTANSGTSTVTGQGVQWSGGAWGAVAPFANPGFDGLLLLAAGAPAHHYSVASVPTSATLLSPGVPTVAAQSQYHITRGLPFRDACVHRDSLVGTGCPQYPNRVYICPPGWDLEGPPGSPPPLVVAAASFDNADPNHFLVDFIDVPSSVDSDPMVAVVPSQGPILCLKSDDAHGIYGDWPSFTQALLPGGQGAGCIDLRSTVSCRWGQFWAGRNGVHQYTGQRVQSITEGRIDSTWRALVAQHLGAAGFFCAAGTSGDKLLVSIGSTGSTGATLCYDLARQVWDGFVTNHQARGYDAPADEARSLVWCADQNSASNGALRDSGGMLAGEGPVVDGGALTTAPAPVMTAETSTGVLRHDGNDGLSKVIDASVTATVLSGTSSGSPTGHAQLGYQVRTSGGVGNQPAVLTPASPQVMTAHASLAPLVRSRVRVGRPARFCSVAVTTASTPTASATSDPYDVIVHQITVSLRDSRERA